MIDFNDELKCFLNESPTPFHAVVAMAKRLKTVGYVELVEGEAWDLQPSGKYFTTRNDSSIAAWVMPSDISSYGGLRMVGAHTDSPCIKVKPTPEKLVKGYMQLGVETYGGLLKAPWFDRDLSLAGRVNYRDQDGKLQSALINFKRPIAIIPSLAIHLAREEANKLEVNAQLHLPPILGSSDEAFDFRALLKDQMLKEGIENVADVLDYELSFYDAQPAGIVGLNEEFIASARLDNLLSCFIGLYALINSNGDQASLLICNDHEEVGSQSAC
ncbi:MAG: M18 family aminopeptidase, partial [Pontibacterium sp.]